MAPQSHCTAAYDATYEIVTGDPNIYHKAVESVLFFRSLGVPVALNFTMIRQNVLDYPKIAKLCQELGIPYTLITDITGHQRNTCFSEALQCRLSPAERACVACHPPEEVSLALERAKELEKELQTFQLPSSPDSGKAPHHMAIHPMCHSWTICPVVVSPTTVQLMSVVHLLKHPKGFPAPACVPRHVPHSLMHVRSRF